MESNSFELIYPNFNLITIKYAIIYEHFALINSFNEIYVKIGGRYYINSYKKFGSISDRKKDSYEIHSVYFNDTENKATIAVYD